MSVQYGRWNFDGEPVDRDDLEKVKPLLSPYGPDGANSYSKGNIGILYHAFHTTEESRRETQPHVAASGTVLTWDGRLDSRAQLIRELANVVTVHSTDVEIVSAAYAHWGTDCFAMLVGDWALSIWNPHNRSLIFAKDPIGTRHLYYSVGKSRITWSTILDPLVLFAGKTFALEEEYIAGWLSFFPATHLTPYVGIDAVPPSCFVRSEPGKCTVARYWEFDPRHRVHYRTDGEHEEHFRQVFAEAVRRRLRSDRPVLAELSGGMDSSSIVSMADIIIAHGGAKTSRVDTVSSYSDAEPDWDERPYFTKVEEKRGRTGCHIDVGRLGFTLPETDRGAFAASPAVCCGFNNEVLRQLTEFAVSKGHSVLLSGIGGDEVLGGIPTCIPELADLAVRFHWKTLLKRAIDWALSRRQPVVQVLYETLREFLPVAYCGKDSSAATLLQRNFLQRNRKAISGYTERLSFFGPLPSFQQNVTALEFLRRQLSSTPPSTNLPLTHTYPYLDRDLLAFLFAIPREQLVRPGFRRSLMRRSLAGIVPPEILHRRRKGFVSYGPAAALLGSRFLQSGDKESRRVVEFGIVCPTLLGAMRQKLSADGDVSLILLLRTLSLESWFTNIDRFNVVDLSRPFGAAQFTDHRQKQPNFALPDGLHGT